MLLKDVKIDKHIDKAKKSNANYMDMVKEVNSQHVHAKPIGGTTVLYLGTET